MTGGFYFNFDYYILHMQVLSEYWYIKMERSQREKASFLIGYHCQV
jgi:hypothetical protein